MASIEVKDAAGKKVEDRDLNASVFGIEPNIHVVHTGGSLPACVLGVPGHA